MTSSPTSSELPPRMKRTAFASSFGNAIELYDFLLYGLASALVFNKLFFPSSDPRIGTLLAFVTFGAGFVVRPLGGIVIGHFGDRVGRKTMLVLTLTITGGCTALIGVLPTYETVGIWAPIMLVALRLAQGFFMGGEQGGAFLMVAEHAPPGRRGWYGGWATAGSPTGSVLATGAFALASAISGDAFLTWGWRLPFLFSIVLVGVGLYVRLSVSESPAFLELKEQQRTAGLPVVEALRTFPGRLLAGTGVNFGFNLFIYVLITFAVAYATDSLGLPQQLMLTGVVVGSAVQVISILAFTRISDRVGRLPIMLSGAIFLAAFAFPLFVLLETRVPALVVLAMCLGFGGSAAIFGPMAAYYTELFDTRVRYSGAALSYQVGAVLGGGLSPAIGSALLVASGGQTWPIALYLLGGAAVSAACLMAVGETSHTPVRPAAGAKQT